MASETPPPIARLPEVKRITGLSRCSIDNYEKAGRFPVRVPIGPRGIGWRLDEIHAWIESRCAMRRAPQPTIPLQTKAPDGRATPKANAAGENS
jgi:prophage regulatory protein